MNAKIYTRDGDGGSTRRLDGRVVRKSDTLVEAVGDIDELSSVIGLCLAEVKAGEEIRQALIDVQNRLFQVGLALAACGTEKPGNVGLDDKCVADLERAIDAAAEKLPPLQHFIAPRGTELAARLHVARSVSRRAERRVVAAADNGINVPPVVMQYLNRLSDFLFTLARLANKLAGQSDTPMYA